MTDFSFAAAFLPFFNIDEGQEIKMIIREKNICQQLKIRRNETNYDTVALYLRFGNNCVETVDMDGKLYELSGYRLALCDRSHPEKLVIFFSNPLTKGSAGLPLVNAKPAQKYIYNKVGLIRCDDYDTLYANYRQPDGRHELYYDVQKDWDTMNGKCTDNILVCPYSY